MALTMFILFVISLIHSIVLTIIVSKDHDTAGMCLWILNVVTAVISFCFLVAILISA